MESKSTRFLTVTPDTLLIEGPYDQKKWSKFAIYNAHGCNLVFKIKSTCPDDISVAPNIGFIKPYERIEVLVTLAGNCFDPTIRNREKFLIQSAVTSVPCTDWATTSAKETIKSVPRPEEVKLTIRFLPQKHYQEEEMESKTENPTLPLESKKRQTKQQQNTGLVVPQTTFFLKNDGSYTQAKELEENMKKHEKQKITGVFEQQNGFFMTPEMAKQIEEEKKRNEQKTITGLLPEQSTFFVKSDGTHLPYASKNAEDEIPIQEPPKIFEKNKSSETKKKQQNPGLTQNNFFVANEDGTCSAILAKSSKSPSESKKKHQDTGTKPKILQNGYQNSTDDGDDESSEEIQKEIKPSRVRKNNFDIPDMVLQSPITDVTETTGQNKPTSSERKLSQKTTLTDENNNTYQKDKIEVPKQAVPSGNTTTTWDWVKDMTRNIKEMGNRMTAMEAKIKEPPKIPQDLISDIKELMDRMSALEAEVKEYPETTQDVTSNIKELRDRVTALEAQQKEPPKTQADEKKNDSDSDNTKRQAMNNEIQVKNAVASPADISSHEIQSKNHLYIGVLTVVALVLAFGLGRESAIGKAV